MPPDAPHVIFVLGKNFAFDQKDNFCSPTRDHPTPPENHTYAQYFQQNPTYLLTVNV